MHHTEETLRLWNELEQRESVYHHWVSLFCLLSGKAKEAESLCDLGMRLVRGEVRPGLELRRTFDHVACKVLDSRR